MNGLGLFARLRSGDAMSELISRSLRRRRIGLPIESALRDGTTSLLIAPPESRIIAVAGAFHAMTAQWPHRAPLMPNDALAMLAGHLSPQFDRQAVDAAFGAFRYARGLRRRIA